MAYLHSFIDTLVVFGQFLACAWEIHGRKLESFLSQRDVVLFLTLLLSLGFKINLIVCLVIGLLHVHDVYFGHKLVEKSVFTLVLYFQEDFSQR